MRIQLAVVEPAADPLTEAGDAETRKFVMPEALAHRLEVLTGGWDSIGDLEGMRTLVARRAKLELRLGPLLVQPPAGEELRLRALLATGLTASQRLHEVIEKQLQSAVGWPMRLLRASVVTRSQWRDGETEHRWLASYRFFEHSGEALLRVGQESLLRSHRDELLALLGSGWPRWSPPSGVAVLSELWQ